jgi:hypothetical protein
MTTEISMKNSLIVWQNDYEYVFEQPILLTPYHDCIGIEQDGKSVSLTYEHAEEFIKAIMKAVKNNPENES